MRTGRIVPLDADIHQAVQALLPWHGSEGLTAAERERLEAHLASCPRCQAELDWERRLQGAYADLPATPEASTAQTETALAALHGRIAVLPRRLAWPQRIARACAAWWRSGTLAWRWALAGQCMAILVLGAVLLRPAPDPAYRALGSAAAPADANAVLMFAPETPEATIRRTLQGADARIVDGPTTAGAYLVRVPDDAALQRLATQPGVRLAQSLRAGALP